MTSRPDPVRAAVDALRVALEGMAVALASGDLSALLAAQDALSAVPLPPIGVAWSASDRQALQASARRAMASLQGCRRTNAMLLSVVDTWLTASDADYNRTGGLAPVAALAGTEPRVSCRV